MSDSQTQWWAPVQGGDAATPAQPPRRQRERHSRRRSRQNRRTVVVVLVVLGLLAGATFVAVSLAKDVFGGGPSGLSSGTEDFTGPGHGSVVVTVNGGDTGAAIGQTLVDAGVVASVGAFTSAYSANPNATAIQPGSYQLLLGIPAADAVEALLDPTSKVARKVTIPEGLTAEQILTRISEKTEFTREDLDAAIADPASIGLPEEAEGNVEGWLFPATYEYQPGDDAASLLAQMTAQTTGILEDRGVPREDWEDVLIEASLIEREAKHDEDRAKMARVIENRLEQGWTLGIDAAVAYGAGKPGTELTTADLEDESNPYNLRVLPGLPPTPIASPGEKSIDAAIAPADGDWMYWVTVNLETGETKFAETNDEHNQYVAELNDWLAEQDG